MQIDGRDLARAEARVETGGKAGPDAREILSNIDAMELAVDAACSSRDVAVDVVSSASPMSASHCPASATRRSDSR